MRRRATFILILCLAATTAHAAERNVRVGVFDLEPLVILDPEGPQGLFIDLVQEVAAVEGWRLTWVEGTWDPHLQALKDGRLDLLPSIAYTAVRDSLIDFTRLPVVTLWSQVFVRHDSDVRNILDLEGRRVAVTRGDINGERFLEYATRFGVECEIVETSSPAEVFIMVAAQEADGGVAPNVFGYARARRYGIEGSPIIFDPFGVYFGVPEGRNADLVVALDDALNRWQMAEDSFYYQRMDHHLDRPSFERQAIPQWLVLVLAGVAVIALLLFLSNRMLNREVRARTAALRGSEERFRLLFESAGDAIFLMSENRFIDCNARTLEIFDCTRKDIIGHTPEEFSPPRQLDGTDTATAAKKRIAAVLAGDLQFFAWRHRRMDGSEFDAEVTLTLLESAGQRIIQAIVRDVTERKRLEAELRQAQKMEAIGTLAGGIAHDFNNILSAILGYGELARLEAEDAAADGELREHLDQVLIAGERARDLVQQILAFSRRSVENRRPLDLAPLIGETLRLLRSTIPATIEIRQELGDCGPVYADPTGIHQILMNLCTNSFQALSGQGGEIKVALAEREYAPGLGGKDDLARGGYAVIEVSDTGPGMAPEVAQKIFEPYFTTKSSERGTGLGLAVVHGIVEDHDGRIDLETAPGEGTCLRVWLPVVTGVDAGPPEAGSETGAPGGDEHILLVDDEADIIGSAELGLRGLGYRVTGCTDPAAALRAFRTDPAAYDLVVTDMTMSGMTGTTFAQAVLKIRPEIPVILCTGYSETVTRESALALGVRVFLMKPVPPSRLAVEVRAVLDEVTT